jgi:cobalamin biosynthesis protein CobT
VKVKVLGFITRIWKHGQSRALAAAWTGAD